MITFEKHDRMIIERRCTRKITSNDSWFREQSLTEVFNFRAHTVTSLTESVVIYNPGGRMSNASGAPVIRNFRDIESADDIIAMHKVLTDMGGTPPAVEELLKDRPQYHKKAGLSG